MSDPIAHRTPGFGGTMTRWMPTSRARRNPWVGPAPPKGRSANRSRSTALRAMSGTRAAYICDVAILPSHQGIGLGKQIVAKLVSMSSGHRKIILYAVPGKEPFYKKLGFKRMTTAMAIFENQAQALQRGYVIET